MRLSVEFCSKDVTSRGQVYMSKKIVIIAGAMGGLGSQLAEYLADEYEVIGIGRSSAKANSTSYRYAQVDLLDSELVSKFCEEEVGEALYGVVNCAGSVANTPIWKMSRAQWDKTISDNLTSCFSLLSAFTPVLRTNELGRFIFMSSIVAQRGSFGASHYAASKGGIESLTKSVALELAPKNITVNAIAPGYMDTGIIREVPDEVLSEVINKIPQRRLGPSVEICTLVSHLLSENASYITGQTIGVNGGL